MRTACSIITKKSLCLWFGTLFILALSLTLSGPGTATAAPTVTAHSPAAGETGVPITATVSASFSEPMDLATITTGSVTLLQPVKIKAIAAGFNYTVALRDNGTVATWGYNGNGQAALPAGLNAVTAISAGSNHILALKSDGTVTAWGDNGSGRTAVPTGLSGVTAIAAGSAHSVAMKNDGTVTAWGYNYQGQTNVPGGLDGVTAIAAGSNHTLALKNDGTVIAWGDNSFGQTAVSGLSGVSAVAAGNYHSAALKADGTVVAWGDNSLGQTSLPAGLSGVIAISARLNYTMALKNDGSIVAWGENSSGQTDTPAGLSGITAIAAGYYHSVALKNDGSMISWGDNSYSQTTLPDGLAGVTSIAAGSGHTVALKSDGTLSAWGYNNHGQADVPEGLSGITRVSTGLEHTLALKGAGTVIAWGRNDSGLAEVPPEALTGVIAVAAGDHHSVALKNDGSVVAWGLNTSGQTGVPGGLTGVTKIAAGAAHTLALVDGAVTAWGSNSYNAISTPLGLSGVIDIAAGGYHSVALKSGGTVVAWGDNTFGQSTVPDELNNANLIAIAAGFHHTAALKDDGTVVAWGANDLGQSSVPAGLDRVVAIAAGKNYTVAVKNDGTLVGWGDNIYGQAVAPQDIYAQHIDAATSYSTGTDSVTLTPAAALPTAATLTATVNSGVRSLDGTHPLADFSWSFTTTDPTPPVTTASPAGGTYDSRQNVTLTANEPATIYYTTNGAAPTAASPVYSGPIPVPVTTPLQFFAMDSAGNSETPQTMVYTLVADTTPPVTTASPAGGTFSSAQNVILSANEPATIYYTTNGANPSTSSPVYSGSIPIPVSTTLNFFARDMASNSESVKSVTYTINLDTTPPITTASPAGGTYSSAQNVTLSANEPATIYYTTNGAAPSTSSPVYAGAIPIPVNTVLKFFARDTAGNSETFRTESYTIKQNQAITFTPLPIKTYGDPSFTLNAVASSGLPVIYTSSNTAVATVSGNTVTIIAAGSTTITASQSGNATYNPAASVARTLTVNKAVLTVGANNATREYGAANPAFSPTYSGFVNGDTQSVLSGSPALTTAATAASPVGSYPITAAAGTLAALNYSFSFVNGTLTVTKAPATVTLDSLSTTYDGTPKAAAAKTVPAGLAVTITYNGSATAPTSVGSYSVVGTVNDPNYQGSASGTMTIAKGDQTIIFSDLPFKTYGDAAFTLTATASSGLAVSYTSSNPAVATVSGSTVTIVGAGTATITANQSGDSNYNAASAVAQTLTVNKAVATLTFDQLTFVYDGSPKPVTVTTVPAGLAVTITYDGSATAPTESGNYSVVATVNDANYQGTATATEEIARKSQTITFGPLPEKTYGDGNFTFSASASSNLTLVFEYDPAIISSIVKQGKNYTATIVGAGTTVITATQPGNRNYSDAPPVSQTLVVNKAAATVTLASLSATYDGSAKSATATTNPAGLAVTFTYNGSAAAPAVAGSYSVIATINNSNYQGNASGILTIAKAGQTVTFGALPVMSYGTAPFNPNAASSSGLAVSYSSSNTAVATVSGSTVTIVGVGTTTITASQSGNGNYNAAAAVTQTLTIAKGAQTITFGPLPVKTVGNAPFTLSATSSSGLTISYSSSNTAVATISGSTVTIVGAGTATITATQGGDGNYNAANSVSRTLTVQAAQTAGGKAKVTIGAVTSYFDTLAATLAAITPGATAQVKLQNLTFAEAINLNINGATVSLSGGYDAAFTNATGMTSIQGSLVISAGTLVVDRLVIM